MKLKYIFTALCALVYGSTAFAQTHANEFGFQSDNDSFLAQGSDRYYTNGLFVFYRHGQHIADADTTRFKNKVLGIELGQKIFNPRSGATPVRGDVDRPFAGYLYAGANMNYLFANESNLKLGVQVGMVGPAALGRQAQQVIHNTFGFYELEGWQYQVRNNFQLNLLGEYNRLLARGTDADISLNTYANLGTGFTGASAGFLVRIGNFNQLFNSVSTQSTAIRQRNFTPLHKNELFFYLKPLLRYVAYDATIDGGLFAKDDPDGLEVTSSSKPIVFSQQFGVNYGGTRWIFDLSATLQTKDTKGMLRAHQWGSASILYRFN